MPKKIALRTTILAAAGALVSAAASAGTETVLYAFQGGTDGNTPYAVPTMDAHGNLYGTTVFGGTAGDVVVYRLRHTKSGWTEKVLHSFAGGTDGWAPYGGVVVDSAGNVYGGTRFGGGSCDCGVVYELSPAATATGRKPFSTHSPAMRIPKAVRWARSHLTARGICTVRQ